MQSALVTVLASAPDGRSSDTLGRRSMAVRLFLMAGELVTERWLVGRL
jgi:hypothetical protein